MAIRLCTSMWTASIDYPRPIPIPNSPSSIFDRKAVLESFPHSPLDRLIFCKNINVSILFPCNILDSKKRMLNTSSINLYDILLWMNFNIDLTTLPECINFPLHSGCLNIRRIYRKSWVLFEFYVFGYGYADHVFLFAICS